MAIIGERFRGFKPVDRARSLRFHAAAHLLLAASIARHYNTSTASRRIRAGGEARRGWKATCLMARPKTSILRRILVQTDCAFWCIHDHLDVLAYLGLPTLAALLASALALVGIWRTWDFPPVVDFLAAGVALPVPGALHLHRAAAALCGLRLEGGWWRDGHGRRVLRLVPAPRRPAAVES